MAEELNFEQAWDIFFYYGQNDLALENKFDLYQAISQPKRSLFYNRMESCGLSEYENNPNSLQLQLLSRYDIANAIAYRNTLVTDGTQGTKDRRIALSQNSIGFETRNGELDIKILYFNFFEYTNPKVFSSPLTSIGG